MIPDVVVDIGNSRIKWGRWDKVQGSLTFVSLPGDSSWEWQEQARRWELKGPIIWAMAGVKPEWESAFTEWAQTRGDRVLPITHKHVTIGIDVAEPQATGIDRLLNALAAFRLKPPQSVAVIVSVGTAVTVDFVEANGTFAGGAILPGPRLMSRSLHLMTAKLPEVDIRSFNGVETPPCKDTRSAIHTGIAFALIGGVERLVKEILAGRQNDCRVFVTGGGWELLQTASLPGNQQTTFRPELTLEGIFFAAESIL